MKEYVKETMEEIEEIVTDDLGGDWSKLTVELLEEYHYGSISLLLVAKELRKHEVEVDVDKLASELDADDTISCLDELLELELEVDLDWLLKEASPEYIDSCCEFLMAHGVSIDKIVERLEGWIIIDKLEDYLAKGATIDQLVDRMSADEIEKNFETLLAHKANINQLLEILDDEDVDINMSKDDFDRLISLGADGDILMCLLLNRGRSLDDWFDVLLPHVNVCSLILGCSYGLVFNRYNEFIEKATDIDELVKRTDPGIVINNHEELIKRNANINADALVSQLGTGVDQYYDELLALGANANFVASKLPSYEIAEHYNDLVKHGADPKTLGSLMLENAV